MIPMKEGLTKANSVVATRASVADAEAPFKNHFNLSAPRVVHANW